MKPNYMVEFKLSRRCKSQLEIMFQRAANLKLIHDRLSQEMDWCAALNNGNPPLSLRKLLSFPDFDFRHDFLGVSTHMNRETGRYDDTHFLPRCHDNEH